MFFRPIAALSSLLFLQGALAALTASQVVTNIGIVTTLSGQLNDLITPLTTQSTASQVKNVAGQIPPKFQAIIDSLGGDVTAMDQTPPMVDADAVLIVAALTDFVNVHQQLLATIIGKHGILAEFGVTAPVAAILRTLEGAIDSFAFSMIAMIPTRQSDVQGDQTTLDNKVTQTYTLYEQFCIPIPPPLYPTLQPICLPL